LAWAALCDRFFAIFRRPILALPVDQMGRGFLGHAFPPHVAVIGAATLVKITSDAGGQALKLVFSEVPGRRRRNARFRLMAVELAVFPRL
jgi:hypothetical protein